MHTITFSDMKRLSLADLKVLLPVTVTFEAEPALMVDVPENIITLTDLHPRIKIQLRAAEQKARLGMPKPEQVYTSHVFGTISPKE